MVTRARTSAVLLLVAGVVLVRVGADRVWYRAGGASWTGTQLTGGLVGSWAWVVAALGLLLLVLGRRGRRVVGVLLVATGTAIIVTVTALDTPAGDELAAAGATVGRTTGAATIALLGGVATALAGALVALTASSGGAGRQVGADPAATGATGGELDLWRAQDAGLDPTVDEDGPGPTPGCQEASR